MPPDSTPGDGALAARALCRELADVYDTLERRLDAAAWDGASELVGRLGELESALRPLMRARGTDADPTALDATWSEVDATAARLAARLPALVARVQAAQQDVAGRLARIHAARTGTRRYRVSAVAPRFASQRV